MNATCLRIINQVDSAGAANVVGTSSVAFANHTSGTITNYWGGEADVSNANTGAVTFLAGWATGVHLRGAGAHGTVTNAINFLAFPCDMPDAATSTFSACYAFFANPTTNGTFNFGYYQSPLTSGGGLAGVNVFSDQVEIQQGLTATSGANFNGPPLSLISSFWNSSAGANDSWISQNVLGTGANPFSVYNVTHSGSTGALFFQLPANVGFQPATTNTGSIGTSTNKWASGNFGTSVTSAAYALVNSFASSTLPTIAAAGCGGTNSTISAANGTASFEILIGTGGATAGGCTVTMPAATTSWTCDANTVSATSTTNYLVKQTGAISTTSVVIQNFSDAAVATAFAASDTIRVKCAAN